MGKQYQDNEINREGHVLDLLSAYIDRSLTDPEREHVRAHIEDCADCRAGYVELQATIHLLHTMPAAPVPRAFTLTPEMATSARRTSLLERIFAPRFAPTFATGSVVAFLVLFFLFASVNFSNTNGPFSYDSPPQAGLMAPTGEVSVQEAPSADNDTTLNMAEPTASTASATGSGDDSARKGPDEPTQPATDTAMLPAPAATPVAEGMGGETPPGTQVTPDTTIAGSETSSPTTVALNPVVPGYTGNSGGSPSTENDSTATQDATRQSASAQSQAGQDMNLLLAIEIGLLAVGLTLAVAAIIARRRAT